MNLPPELIWFLAGLVLVLLELVAPGVILIFFGIGAWVTATAIWLGLADGIAAQSIIFAVSSCALLFTLRRVLKSWFVGKTCKEGQIALEEFLGKEVNVITDIPGGHAPGKVELKGAEWNATSASPLKSGSLAVVVERQGLALVVEPR